MPKIIIYTSNNCNPCKLAKDFFAANQYEFEERNVAENKQYRDELLNMGYRSTPTIVINTSTSDKQKIFAGFNQSLINKELNNIKSFEGAGEVEEKEFFDNKRFKQMQ